MIAQTTTTSLTQTVNVVVSGWECVAVSAVVLLLPILLWLVFRQPRRK